MAKAKRPKQQKAEEKRALRFILAEQALQVDVVDTDLDRFTVAVYNLPMPVRRRIRSETGRRWEDHQADARLAGIDTYALLWWVSRLVAGEDITCEACDAEWAVRCAGVTLGNIAPKWVTVGAPTDEDADPEA